MPVLCDVKFVAPFLLLYPNLLSWNRDSCPSSELTVIMFGFPRNTDIGATHPGLNKARSSRPRTLASTRCVAATWNKQRGESNVETTCPCCERINESTWPFSEVLNQSHQSDFSLWGAVRAGRGDFANCAQLFSRFFIKLCQMQNDCGTALLLCLHEPVHRHWKIEQFGMDLTKVQ